MKRKIIEAVPMETRTLEKTREDYTGFSQILTIGEEKILILDLYETKKLMEPEAISPFKRYVTNRKDFETYRPEADKPWGKNGLEESYYYTPDIYFPEGADEAIFELLPKDRWSYKDSARERLERNEKNIKQERNSKKREYHQNAIDRRIALADKFPSGIERWYKSLFKEDHFVFYETISPRKAAGTCSGCTSTIEYDRKVMKPAHNENGICPICGVKIIYKVKGKVQQVQLEKKAIIMQKIPGGFVSRYMKLDYRAGEHGEALKIREVARTTYNGSRIYEDFSYTDYRGQVHWTDGNTNMVAVGTGYLYTRNLNQVLDGTKFKYCAISLLQKHTDGPIHQDVYLRSYEQHPYLEYMVKMGLYKLANEYVTHAWEANLNSNGKRPEDILRISREKIKRLIKLNGGIQTLSILQLEESTGRTLTDEELRIMERYGIKSRNLLEATEFTTVGKILKYAKKQLKDKKTAGHFISDWMDYIRMCMGAGLQLNETLMFPRSLKAEHDKRVSEFKAIEDTKKNEQYQKLRESYIEKYSFRHGKYEIVVPESLESIVQEGNNQHHCVGTYVDRVAEGRTCILFLRERDALEQSFYTVEVSGNMVVQCRGKYNRAPSPEIRKKIKNFTNKFQKYIEHKNSEVRIQVPA